MRYIPPRKNGTFTGFINNKKVHIACDGNNEVVAIFMCLGDAKSYKCQVELDMDITIIKADMQISYLNPISNVEE